MLVGHVGLGVLVGQGGLVGLGVLVGRGVGLGVGKHFASNAIAFSLSNLTISTSGVI